MGPFWRRKLRISLRIWRAEMRALRSTPWNWGILTTPRGEDGKIHITLDVAAECIQKRVVKYDKTGG